MTDPINDPYKTYVDPSEEPTAILKSGTVLAGKYRLIRQIGRGGMGVIWSADDTVAERKIVLKFVPGELRNFEATVSQFKESFKRIHELQHQHICPVYTLEEDSSLGYYLTMKWLDGETLDKYVRRTVGRENPLPLEKVLRILRPIAEALDYAHGNRIIHRDIKPSNIFIVLDKTKAIRDVQVIDFDLASEIRNTLSRVSQMKFDTSGTRPYMAPEQWRARRQTEQTDQYALGVVAYELLSGYLPFDNGDIAALRLAVLQDKPEPIRKMPNNINAALQKAMAKDVDDRFGSCTEFVKALEGAKIPEIKAPPPTLERRSDMSATARDERKRHQQYERLSEESKKASTEDDWRKLARQFREMNGYKNTAELAIQCDNQIRRIKERQIRPVPPLQTIPVPPLQTIEDAPDTISTYLIWSVVSAVLFFPIGGFALYFSLKCKFDMAKGRYESAAKNSKRAFRINVGTAILIAISLFGNLVVEAFSG